MCSGRHQRTWLGLTVLGIGLPHSMLLQDLRLTSTHPHTAAASCSNNSRPQPKKEASFHTQGMSLFNSGEGHAAPRAAPLPDCSSPVETHRRFLGVVQCHVRADSHKAATLLGQTGWPQQSALEGTKLLLRELLLEAFHVSASEGQNGGASNWHGRWTCLQCATLAPNAVLSQIKKSSGELRGNQQQSDIECTACMHVQEGEGRVTLLHLLKPRLVEAHLVYGWFSAWASARSQATAWPTRQRMKTTRP